MIFKIQYTLLPLKALLVIHQNMKSLCTKNQVILQWLVQLPSFEKMKSSDAIQSPIMPNMVQANFENK